MVVVAFACHSNNQGELASEAQQQPRDDVPVVEVPGVDLSRMTEHEKGAWSKLMDEQLSPCGDPVSLAKCASESKGCRLCVPAARYLARLVMDGEVPQTIEENYRDRFDPKEKQELAIDDSPVRGAPMAPVTIVEFSDFQCPYCGRAHPVVKDALGKYTGKVKLVFKHYPLSGHPRAMPAAKAAEAARLQDKFWEMQDMLFEHQDRLEDGDLVGYASSLGLDLQKFEEDMASKGVADRIARDRALGAKVGVASTPTLFINGRRFTESLRNLEAYLAEETEL